MSEEKENAILSAVKSALGADVQYFNVTKDEILDEDENYFSMTALLEPNDYFEQFHLTIKESKNYLQVMHGETGFVLLVGEDGDTELDLSYGNIYAQLYWGEVLQEK